MEHCLHISVAFALSMPETDSVYDLQEEVKSRQPLHLVL